jgi:hypothetical protein
VPYSDRYFIRSKWREWSLPFASRSLAHADELRTLLVIVGTRTIEVNGKEHCLSFNDLPTLPSTDECGDIAASDNREAIWVHLRKSTQ